MKITRKNKFVPINLKIESELEFKSLCALLEVVVGENSFNQGMNYKFVQFLRRLRRGLHDIPIATKHEANFSRG